jgi:hypothetical protein
MRSLVKDLMTTQVVTVAPETPFKEIVAAWPTSRSSGPGAGGPSTTRRPRRSPGT